MVESSPDERVIMVQSHYWLPEQRIIVEPLGVPMISGCGYISTIDCWVVAPVMWV